MLAIRLSRGVVRRGWMWDSALAGRCITHRPSTSGILHDFDHVRIDSEEAATALMHHLQPQERARLLKVLSQAVDQLESSDAAKAANAGELTYRDTRQLFLFNTLPFVGFGILDNMIMILAGEYIDQSLGAMLSISTMAAAALGNIISDVAGVGLAHYVELFVQKLGIKHPVLTAAQLESSKARYTVNSARAVGLVVGCFIGMFPLLFFHD